MNLYDEYVKRAGPCPEITPYVPCAKCGLPYNIWESPFLNFNAKREPVHAECVD